MQRPFLCFAAIDESFSANPQRARHATPSLHSRHSLSLRLQACSLHLTRTDSQNLAKRAVVDCRPRRSRRRSPRTRNRTLSKGALIWQLWRYRSLGPLDSTNRQKWTDMVARHSEWRYDAETTGRGGARCVDASLWARWLAVRRAWTWCCRKHSTRL